MFAEAVLEDLTKRPFRGQQVWISELRVPAYLVRTWWDFTGRFTWVSFSVK